LVAFLIERLSVINRDISPVSRFINFVLKHIDFPDQKKAKKSGFGSSALYKNYHFISVLVHSVKLWFILKYSHQ